VQTEVYDLIVPTEAYDKYNGFCFDFSFHLVFAFNLARFCGCFSAISFIVRFCHSRFLERFCGNSCLDLLELSDASRSERN
jgi:hypothetical protein